MLRRWSLSCIAFSVYENPAPLKFTNSKIFLESTDCGCTTMWRNKAWDMSTADGWHATLNCRVANRWSVYMISFLSLPQLLPYWLISCQSFSNLFDKSFKISSVYIKNCNHVKIICMDKSVHETLINYYASWWQKQWTYNVMLGL